MAAFKGAFYAELGRRIRAARDDAGITQAALARVLGLSRTSVTNIERGRQPVYLHSLVEIARAVNVAVATLIPEPAAPGKVKLPRRLRSLDTEKRQWVERVMSGSTATPSEKPHDN